MSTLMSSGAVLAASRLSNFAVLLLSPLLLVRLLDVDAYGQYQEFMVYAMLLVAVCGFTLDSSITYFLPKNEKFGRAIVSQTSALIFTSSIVCVAILLLARPLILKVVSYDFIWPLAAFVFFFVNVNWLEYYWIAKRRTDLILYYSLVRVTARVSTLLVVAYLTRDITSILWALVAVEAVRVTVVTTGLFALKMFTLTWNGPLTSERLRFSGPLGLGLLAGYAGHNLPKMFVAAALGPAALAYYAIASYLIPAIEVVRQSLSDVIFPDLVRSIGNPLNSLRLWQRANVMACVVLIPTAIALGYHAEVIVVTLFTEAYQPAVPLFQIYAVWIVRRCFNSDVLLRTRGKTGLVLAGIVYALLVNLALMTYLYYRFGLIGPAAAFVASEIMLEMYYARRVRQEFGWDVSTLVDWTAVIRLIAGCVVGFPLLVFAKHFPGPDFMDAITSSIAFFAVCWFVAYRLGIEDIGRLVSFTLHPIRKYFR